MEIHSPEGPVHGFKDFLVHISIVTVGILIALGLEGVREAIHNRHLVRESRENVSAEMAATLGHATNECKRVGDYSRTLQALAAAMPDLAKQHPDEFRAKLNSDVNPGYFLSVQSYQVALSTGVLAHMPTEEVSAYAYAAEGTKNYLALQTNAIAEEAQAKAYAGAHPKPNADELGIETERIMLFADAERGAAQVCPQVRSDIAKALRVAEAR